MAEYDSEAFRALWRKSGFIVALDSLTGGKTTPAEYRTIRCRLMRLKIAEMRKEMRRIQAVLDRLDHDTMAGAHGGKVNALHLERNAVELGGWIASVAEWYGAPFMIARRRGVSRTEFGG